MLSGSMVPGHSPAEQLPSKSQRSQASMSFASQSGSNAPQPQWQSDPSPQKRSSHLQFGETPVQTALLSGSMGPGHPAPVQPAQHTSQSPTEAEAQSTSTTPPPQWQTT